MKDQLILKNEEALLSKKIIQMGKEQLSFFNFRIYILRMNNYNTVYIYVD